MLNLNRLIMLREVAARKTIASAAESLFMSPSAVSQQMSVLEREAGVPLLERHGRGVRLTDAGQRLVRDTENILAEMEHAEAHLALASAGVVGHLRVSAFPTAARSVFVPALVELGQKHPNLRISMFDLEPEESIPALRARELDLVLTYEWNLLPALSEAGVDFEDLFWEPVYLAMPAQHPIALENRPVSIAELEREEWIVGRDSTSMLDLVKAATRGFGYEPLTDFHTMDFGVILSAVAAGLGVALAPPLALTGDLAGVAVRDISDLEMRRTIRAGVRRGSRSNPALSTVLEAVRNAAAAVRL